MNAHKANALRKKSIRRVVRLCNARRHEAAFTSTDAKCSEHDGYSPRTLRSFPLHPTSCPLCPRIKCLHLDTAKGKNGEVFTVTAWRHKGGTQVQRHSLSISILDELTSRPVRIIPGEGTPVPTEQKAEWTPRDCPDVLEKRKISCS